MALPCGSQYSVDHANPMGVGFRGGDTALVIGGRLEISEGTPNSK
jgi:hypothetical protein